MEVDSTLLSYVSGTMATAGAVLYGLQKALKSWSADKKDILKDNIETDLFQRLSDETKRQHDQNVTLSSTIESLRAELARLHQEVSSLRVENTTLRLEVAALHDGINQFRHRASMVAQPPNPPIT